MAEHIVAEIRIALSGKRGAGKFALVDRADFALVAPYRWSLSVGRYAQARVDGEVIRMHRLLLAPPAGATVDHLNGDGLDNRRSNLRVVRRRRSRHPRRFPRPAAPLYRGVSWDKRAGKWRAQIRVNMRQVRLGLFTDPREAALAYDAAALHHRGEGAVTNASLGLL